MASIHDILRPITFTRVVSREMQASQWLLNFMGMNPGGINEVNEGHGREGSYQTFNSTRKVGLGRAPGTAAGTGRKQQVGRVPFTYPRMHESIPLLAETLHNLARIGDPRQRDIAGARMIQRQAAFLAQKAANFRATMVAGMLRDSLYVTEDGDDWYFTYSSSGSLFQINFQVPAGNKSQLDMLGGGDIIDVSWDNPSADIPRHLGEIDAAFTQLYGGRLENVLVQNSVWQNIIKNDHVASQAGIANAPFRQFERTVGTKPDGSPLTESVGELTCRPGLKFYITDEGVDLGAQGSETFTKYVPDNGAIFLPNPTSGGVFSMYIGSEPISERDGAPQTVKAGLNAWSVDGSNPTTTDLFVLDNALAVPHIPNAIANATVVF